MYSHTVRLANMLQTSLNSSPGLLPEEGSAYVHLLLAVRCSSVDLSAALIQLMAQSHAIPCCTHILAAFSLDIKLFADLPLPALPIIDSALGWWLERNNICNTTFVNILMVYHHAGQLW